MNLIPYIGQYLKIITQDLDWFIGKLIQVYGQESEYSLEFEFDIITFNKDSKYTKGIDSLKSVEIRGIEELDPKVLQGLILTLNNVPNIINAYHLINTNELPKKIEFGKTEEDKFLQARKEEMKYHENFYSENALFEPGTWLSKPVKIVMDMLELIDLNEINILDLGCGVGRNSIPIAQKVKAHGGMITCVDLLQKAVDYLIENSKKFDVQNNIIALKADAESYNIEPNYFNYIVACSCLEHVSSVDAFRSVVSQMIQGTRDNGINTILMSTEVQDFDVETGELSEGLIELNLKTDETFLLLHELYKGWEIIVERYLPQKINEKKYGKDIEFRSNWLTFVARRIQKHEIGMSK